MEDLGHNSSMPLSCASVLFLPPSLSHRRHAKCHAEKNLSQAGHVACCLWSQSPPTQCKERLNEVRKKEREASQTVKQLEAEVCQCMSAEPSVSFRGGLARFERL